MDNIKLEIPVYYTQKFKTKKDKTILISMSWYRNAFYHAQNALKKDIGEIVKAKLKAVGMKPLKGQFEVTYKYYYKNKTSDLLNCGAMSSKILLDVLQEEGYVVNDNVQFCIKEVFEVGIQDRDNPRMAIEIIDRETVSKLKG